MGVRKQRKGVWTPVVLSALIHTRSARCSHAPYCSQQRSESSDPDISKQARLATSISYLEKVMNKKCLCMGEFQSSSFFFFFNLSEYDAKLQMKEHKQRNTMALYTTTVFPKTHALRTQTSTQKYRLTHRRAQEDRQILYRHYIRIKNKNLHISKHTLWMWSDWLLGIHHCQYLC